LRRARRIPFGSVINSSGLRTVRAFCCLRFGQRYYEFMRFQMPPPALGGIVFNLLMLATPVIAFKYFGPPWVIAGLWVAVIGLAWFFFWPRRARWRKCPCRCGGRNIIKLRRLISICKPSVVGSNPTTGSTSCNAGFLVTTASSRKDHPDSAVSADQEVLVQRASHHCDWTHPRVCPGSSRVPPHACESFATSRGLPFRFFWSSLNLPFRTLVQPR